MSDKRKRCPICECVMHGPRHYGSERTCLLVLDLKDRLARAEQKPTDEEVSAS